MGATRAGVRRSASRGQAMTEFALVFPITVLVVFGVLTLGLWVFYQQMVTNVAREAARWAAIHSSTAICPTTSWRDPLAPPTSYPLIHCDGPDTSGNQLCPGTSWPCMISHARAFVWGTAPTGVFINACWSGYLPTGTYSPPYRPPFPQADYPAVQPDGSGGTQANQLIQCTIDGHDPTTDAGALGCRQGMTTADDDPASDIPGNQVTAYACFEWSPPMAGFLMIPSSVTMRAVITEVIHRQQ